MSKLRVALIVLSVSVVVTAVSSNSFAAPSPKDVSSGSGAGVVNKPISEGKAAVAPDSVRVNGKKGEKVVIASGVKMKKIDKVNSISLTGKGGRGNGCLKQYGTSAQCLSLVSPAAYEMGMTAEQMPWTCTQVRALFSKGLKVNAGGDFLKLDSNLDGMACGLGDK